jgi:hypothetical protein
VNFRRQANVSKISPESLAGVVCSVSLAWDDSIQGIRAVYRGRELSISARTSAQEAALAIRNWKAAIDQGRTRAQTVAEA